MRKTFTYVGIVLLMLCAAYGVLVATTAPSLTRDWSPDQAVMPHADFDGDTVRLSNIRNDTYRSTTDYDVHYYEKTFALSDVESVWYAVEPFAGYPLGGAHTLVSFGLKDGSYIAISGEIRKEKGESFSPLNGVLRQYELMYVIADERDVLGLRANYRHDDVYLYPLQLSPEQAQTMLKGMLVRANALATQPEFYNTLTNNCTTNIIDHLNAVGSKLGWNPTFFMPAGSDEYLQKAGLIDQSLPLSDLRAKYKINDKALLYAGDPLFSQKIRI